MPKEKIHDLHEFMRQISDEMAAEYNRIQMRSPEDSGTAGDQGEENWTELLRDWLPRTCEVVTKGRIISADGRTSPQVDVLVLKDVYPEKLLTKKLYLAAGVAAAFECKTTLKAWHIEDAVKTCAEIKNLYPTREGTPYKELHTPIVYGLLAHSHSWRGDNSAPADNIERQLVRSDKSHVKHPRETLDFLCVSDFGTWVSSKISILKGKLSHPGFPNGSAQTSYLGYTNAIENQVGYFTPISILISKLFRRLAWENPIWRDLGDYYLSIGNFGDARGSLRPWPTSIYTEKIRQRVESYAMVSPTDTMYDWNEWHPGFV